MNIEENINYINTSYEDNSTVLKLDDNGQLKYITVELGMIFVDSHEPTEMRRLINDEDYSPEEAYDTIDSVDYFSKSRYADLIITALLQAVNTLFRKSK